MDRKTVIGEIQKFVDASNKIGVKLTFCALVPEMENYEETTYILQLYSNWFENKTFSEILNKLVPVLFDNTIPEVRKKIFYMSIYDKKGKIHCRFPDLILENEIGYNPNLIPIDS